MLILFYDGVCGFCNKTVQHILHHDKKKEMRFAALQSELAKKTLGKLATDLQTVVLYEKEEDRVTLYTRSDAALRIAQYLGSVYQLTVVFKIIPKRIRDLLYSLIAKYRYRVFGKYETCPIPSKEVRERFILE